jgi:hypothetical protein
VKVKRLAKRKTILTLSVASVLLIAVAIWVIADWSTASGDPGGKVMDQLTPTVSSLPGYGSGAVPWVNQIPQSLTPSYAVRIEPFQDSCDGIAGTQGWSQVVVQAGFKWTKGFSALVAEMSPRLTKLGWSVVTPRQATIPPSQDWNKTLDNGSAAHVSVSESAGSYSSYWQLDAMAKPIGKAASGC